MTTPATPSPLDRAVNRAYWRLLPLLFLCYVVAYVDRTNVAIAKLTMVSDLPRFDNAVIGFGSGVFFLGYFLLEIPGTLLVEKWSARKWISRIMITWGIVAALTAWVTEPWHFYALRFLLGLAEAGFFPGVIVYLTHWFPSQDRARALSWFFTAATVASFTSPKLCNLLLRIGTEDTPPVAGLVGWQWVYVAWGLPAIVLGVVVLLLLTDRPGQASWLSVEEREALEAALAEERARRAEHGHMTVGEALRNPRVLTLATAYFCVLTGSYGIEFFMPSVLQSWYQLKLDNLTSLLVLPPLAALGGLLLAGWNSDRTRERRYHAVVPIACGALAMITLALLDAPPLWLTVALFVVGVMGKVSYMPGFWSLPSLFLTEAAAAGSIGLINSVGNLGGFIGPYLTGQIETWTGSFRGGLLILGLAMAVSATIIARLDLGQEHPATPAAQ